MISTYYIVYLLWCSRPLIKAIVPSMVERSVIKVRSVDVSFSTALYYFCVYSRFQLFCFFLWLDKPLRVFNLIFRNHVKDSNIVPILNSQSFLYILTFIFLYITILKNINFTYIYTYMLVERDRSLHKHFIYATTCEITFLEIKFINIFSLFLS